MRRAAKRDANHGAIVGIFRQLGCSVFETDRMGAGWPDIVIGVIGRNVLVEIKNADTGYGRGGLNLAQERFNEAWRGDKVVVIRTEDEAMALVANLRRPFVIDKGAS